MLKMTTGKCEEDNDERDGYDGCVGARAQHEGTMVCVCCRLMFESG